MFKNLKWRIQNKDLQEENLALYEENKQNRLELEEIELQKYHIEILVIDTLKQLDLLEEIEQKEWTEELKKKNRNTIINKLRLQNVNIIKELDRSGKQASSK